MFINFVDTDWLFLCNSCPYVLFESLSHVTNQESHVHLSNLGTFIFRNFEISLFLLQILQNFKKINSGNLSQIPLLNMWSLVQIKLDDSLGQCLATSRGKNHQKNLRGQIWAKQAKIRRQIRFFIIFLKVHGMIAWNNV